MRLPSPRGASCDATIPPLPPPFTLSCLGSARVANDGVALANNNGGVLPPPPQQPMNAAANTSPDVTPNDGLVDTMPTPPPPVDAVPIATPLNTPPGVTPDRGRTGNGGDVVMTPVDTIPTPPPQPPVDAVPIATQLNTPPGVTPDPPGVTPDRGRAGNDGDLVMTPVDTTPPPPTPQPPVDEPVTRHSPPPPSAALLIRTQPDEGGEANTRLSHHRTAPREFFSPAGSLREKATGKRRKLSSEATADSVVADTSNAVGLTPRAQRISSPQESRTERRGSSAIVDLATQIKSIAANMLLDCTPNADDRHDSSPPSNSVEILLMCKAMLSLADELDQGAATMERQAAEVECSQLHVTLLEDKLKKLTDVARGKTRGRHAFEVLMGADQRAVEMDNLRSQVDGYKKKLAASVKQVTLLARSVAKTNAGEARQTTIADYFRTPTLPGPAPVPANEAKAFQGYTASESGQRDMRRARAKVQEALTSACQGNPTKILQIMDVFGSIAEGTRNRQGLAGVPHLDLQVMIDILDGVKESVHVLKNGCKTTWFEPNRRAYALLAAACGKKVFWIVFFLFFFQCFCLLVGFQRARVF